jgi:hypothetical protein
MASYRGSGALHDRVSSSTDKEVKNLPGRGSSKDAIIPVNKSHFYNPTHDKSNDKEAPGMMSSTPMKLGKTHGFRAHKSHEKLHGNVVQDNDTALRYSGNDAAHRLGCRKSGKFTKIQTRLAGICGEGEVAMVKGKEDSSAKVQKGNKKQPKKGSGDKNFPGNRRIGKK